MMPHNGHLSRRASMRMTDQDAPGLRPKIIGARVKRVEDPRLLTGQGAFADDRLCPGALHVAFRRSDQSHARISSIECSEARRMPGVVAVFTAAELEGLVNPIVATSRMKNYYATPIHLLARDKVRYVGEPIVAILAESRYCAEDAVEHISVEFEPLADVADPERAVEPGASLLHEGAGTGVVHAREFAR